MVKLIEHLNEPNPGQIGKKFIVRKFSIEGVEEADFSVTVTEKSSYDYDQSFVVAVFFGKKFKLGGNTGNQSQGGTAYSSTNKLIPSLLKGCEKFDCLNLPLLVTTSQEVTERERERARHKEGSEYWLNFTEKLAALERVKAEIINA